MNRKYHNIYDYDHFRELGRIARLANVDKFNSPRVVSTGDGQPVMYTTRTQRAFWRLGWESEDELQRVMKGETTENKTD